MPNPESANVCFVCGTISSKIIGLGRASRLALGVTALRRFCAPGRLNHVANRQ